MDTGRTGDSGSKGSTVWPGKQCRGHTRQKNRPHRSTRSKSRVEKSGSIVVCPMAPRRSVGEGLPKTYGVTLTLCCTPYPRTISSQKFLLYLPKHRRRFNEIYSRGAIWVLYRPPCPGTYCGDGAAQVVTAAEAVTPRQGPREAYSGEGLDLIFRVRGIRNPY